MSCVLTSKDTRLTDPSSPFFNKDVQFIVHWHKIRLMRSMEYAKAKSRTHKIPSYVVQARNETAQSADTPKLTDIMKNAFLDYSVRKSYTIHRTQGNGPCAFTQRYAR